MIRANKAYLGVLMGLVMLIGEMVLGASIQEDSAKNMIFPNSSKVKLTEKECMGMKTDVLVLGRNEIYARKGHVFKKPFYKNYFSKKSWYHPKKEVEEKDLKAIEKYNIKYLKYLEEDTQDIYKPYPVAYTIYVANKPFKIDINGDGKKDTILYTYKEAEKHSSGESYTLYVNGKKVQKVGDHPYPYVAIVDLNKQDNYKEIAVGDSGPSADYSTTFYRFLEEEKLKEIGTVLSDYERQMRIDGTGKIVCDVRGSILQSWYISKGYYLTPHHTLEEVAKGRYFCHYPTFTKQAVTLYSSKSKASKILKVPEGTKATIIETDDTSWCLLELEDGRQGWLYVEGMTLEGEKEAKEVLCNMAAFG